jgi:hypothetical protein
MSGPVDRPLRVTFDSNAYRQVVDPSRARRDATLEDLTEINAALRDRRVRGYFSETVITLEGIENKDRIDVLGSTRLESETRITGTNKITISINVRQDRKPLNPKFSDWIQAARRSGMRALRGPARMGWVRVNDDDGTFFESLESEIELAERLERANEVATAIQARGLGYAAAVSLGLQFSARGGAVDELWLQGLRRAQDESERQKIRKAIAEWADADSIAAHVGYGIDLFCSEDKGKSTGGAPSILDPTNRAWLISAYGITFVTLSELAALLS